MKYLTTGLALLLLITSSATQAGLMSYNDFTFDSDTNYVSGAGSQWLRWTETKNRSISEVLADQELQDQGWRVANKTNVLSLFNTWFGRDRLFKLFPSAEQVTAQETFIEFFGKTENVYDRLYGNWITSSNSLFINDQGTASLAEAWIDGDFINFEIDATFNKALTYTSDTVGVFLVRDDNIVVPTPTTWMLLITGLVILSRKRLLANK